jgi:hypothetical protein
MDFATIGDLADSQELALVDYRGLWTVASRLTQTGAQQLTTATVAVLKCTIGFGERDFWTLGTRFLSLAPRPNGLLGRVLLASVSYVVSRYPVLSLVVWTAAAMHWRLIIKKVIDVTIRTVFGTILAIVYRLLEYNHLHLFSIDGWFQTTLPHPYRKTFQKHFSFPAPIAAARHSHGMAAGLRYAADVALTNFAKQTGRKRFDISTCKRTRDMGVLGCHGIFNPKDLAYPSYGGIDQRSIWDFLLNRREDRFLFTTVDVDQHIHMPTILGMGAPVAVYTLNPWRTAGPIVDGNFCTLADGRRQVTIMGNALYPEIPWNYETDHLYVPTWFGGYSYLVDRIRQPGDDDHQVILLTPTGWSFCLWSRWESSLLRKQNNVYMGKSGRVYCARKTLLPFLVEGDAETKTEHDAVCKWVYSFSEPRSGVSAVYAEQGLANASARLAAEKMVGGSAVHYLKCGQVVVSEVDLSIAAGLFSEMRRDGIEVFAVEQSTRNLLELVDQEVKAAPEPVLPGLLPTPVTPPPADIDPLTKHYTPVVEGIEPGHGKPTMNVVCAEIIPGVASPTSSLASDATCINGRVNAPRNAELPPDNEDERLMREFLDEFLAGEQLHPYSAEEIREMQNRPAQRARNDNNWDMLGSHINKAGDEFISSFQKREVAQSVTDPRNICQVTVENSINVARYTYAIADKLKTHKWYAFGLDPRALGDRVHEVAKSGLYWSNTDYSRWDGTMGAALTRFEHFIFAGSFSAEFYEEIAGLFASHNDLSGHTKFGIAFYLFWARVSGSGETSIGNTLCNAWMAYKTYRMAGLTHQEAWRLLGVYGGDDGLTIVVEGMDMEAVAQSYGAKLKIVNQPTCKPTTFLGRLFYAPTEHPVHVADVRRAVSKIDMSTLDGSRALALYAKTSSWAVSDPETPLIMSIIQAVTNSILGSNPPLLTDKQMAAVARSALPYVFKGALVPFYRPSEWSVGGLDTAVYENLRAPPEVVGQLSDYLCRTHFHVWDLSPWTACFEPLEVKIPAILGPDSLRVGPQEPLIIEGLRDGKMAHVRKTEAQQAAAAFIKQSTLDDGLYLAKRQAEMAANLEVAVGVGFGVAKTTMKPATNVVQTVTAVVAGNKPVHVKVIPPSDNASPEERRALKERDLLKEANKAKMSKEEKDLAHAAKRKAELRDQVAIIADALELREKKKRAKAKKDAGDHGAGKRPANANTPGPIDPSKPSGSGAKPSQVQSTPKGVAGTATTTEKAGKLAHGSGRANGKGPAVAKPAAGKGPSPA